MSLRISKEHKVVCKILYKSTSSSSHPLRPLKPEIFCWISYTFLMCIWVQRKAVLPKHQMTWVSTLKDDIWECYHRTEKTLSLWKLNWWPLDLIYWCSIDVLLTVLLGQIGAGWGNLDRDVYVGSRTAPVVLIIQLLSIINLHHGWCVVPINLSLIIFGVKI